MSEAGSSEGSFKARYSRWAGCGQPNFSGHCFLACLNRRSFVLHRLLVLWDSDFFKKDKEFIREIGATVSRSEFQRKLNRFHGRNQRDFNWFRKLFRISGGRLIRIEAEVTKWEATAYGLLRDESRQAD